MEGLSCWCDDYEILQLHVGRGDEMAEEGSFSLLLKDSVGKSIDCFQLAFSKSRLEMSRFLITAAVRC